MEKTLGILMDPIASINPYKDSSLAMLQAAQTRGFKLLYFTAHDLFYADNTVRAAAHELTVYDSTDKWFKLDNAQEIILHKDLDVLLFRTDPPVDLQYFYLTYLLELAQNAGLLIINSPAGVREANEKLFTLNFPPCIAPTMVTSNQQQIKKFISQYNDIIVKPLNCMGGKSIFRIKKDDVNTNVILDTITNNGSQTIMAQKFIPEITHGDKRILLINGEPFKYGIARVPATGDFRGNLVAGATTQGFKLSAKDLELCNNIADTLKKYQLYFVGIDVIGDYITEINVTSPTCIKEMLAIHNIDVADLLMKFIEDKLCA
jgi:glutathione synthase